MLELSKGLDVIYIISMRYTDDVCSVSLLDVNVIQLGAYFSISFAQNSGLYSYGHRGRS